MGHESVACLDGYMNNAMEENRRVRKWPAKEQIWLLSVETMVIISNVIVPQSSLSKLLTFLRCTYLEILMSAWYSSSLHQHNKQNLGRCNLAFLLMS